MRFYSCWRISRICRARAMRRRSRRRCICTRTQRPPSQHIAHTSLKLSSILALTHRLLTSLPTSSYPPYISKSCYIQSCCANSGEGLHEGLDWLSSNMPEDNQKS